MNRRIWKEFHALWPYGPLLLAAGAVLAVYVRFYPPVPLPEWGSTNPADRANYETLSVSVPHYYACIALGLLVLDYLGLLLMAVLLFGLEFRHGAIDRLLAQPITRSRIWAEKMMVMGLICFATVIVGIMVYWQMDAWVERMGAISGYQGTLKWFTEDLVERWVIASILIGLVATASGSLVSLWIRQTHTAFWGALIFPFVVFTLIGLLDLIAVKPFFHFSIWSFCASQGFEPSLVFAIAWSLVALPLGWLKFKRLEV